MLIGREIEIALLAERLQQGRSVAILGEAGVGKTTLIRVAAAVVAKRIVEAGALATLAWLPYLPLRRAFGRDFDVGDAAYVAAQVEAALGDALLFVDDLHWADAQTRALLPLLSHRVPFVTALRRGDPGTTAALEAVASAGFELIPLEPLSKADAARLARKLHPELSHRVVGKLVTRSGGNPFLLEQLAATGEPSESLRLAVAARLRNLSAAGRDAMASLALLGRPAEVRLLGPGTTELIAAGFAQGESTVAVRHALLAETTIEMLQVAEKQRLHSRLAASLPDLGEAARHHSAAGERTLAYVKAMHAATDATTPGERAAHLAVAAANATGEDADSLRMDGAAALVETGAYGEAGPLLDAITSSDPDVLARRALLRGKLRNAEEDVHGARDSILAGIALAHDPDLAVRLKVEEARISSLFELDPPLEALAKARRILADAHAAGRHEAEAHHAVGTAAAVVDVTTGDWEEHLREAVRRAHTEGLLDLEFKASHNLALFLGLSGRSQEGLDLVLEQIDRARELRLLGHERALRGSLTHYWWHRGEYKTAVEVGEGVLSEPIERATRYMVEWYVASALTDLGEFDRARAALAPALELAEDRYGTYGEAVWALAELEYWAGRPAVAIALADQFLGSYAEYVAASWVEAIRAWARLDAGIRPGKHEIAPTARIVAAAPIEHHALELLFEGRSEQAVLAFEHAADLWRGNDFRGEMRATWGAAEALRRGGDLVDARERLHNIEKIAAERGMRPLLARVNRSLRLAGERRAASRTREGSLTGREREILGLVSVGLTNAEIARRLGIGRPTVVRLIGNAQNKLGATSRAQAAAFAARQ